MSQKFLDVMDQYKIKLVLVPKEAHLKMGRYYGKIVCSEASTVTEDEERDAQCLSAASNSNSMHTAQSPTQHSWIITSGIGLWQSSQCIGRSH